MSCVNTKPTNYKLPAAMPAWIISADCRTECQDFPELNPLIASERIIIVTFCITEKSHKVWAISLYNWTYSWSSRNATRPRAFRRPMASISTRILMSSTPFCDRWVCNRTYVLYWLLRLALREVVGYEHARESFIYVNEFHQITY